MKLLKFAFAGAMFVSAIAASTIASAADLLTIQLKDGPVVIQLMPDVAPKHVAQIEALAKKGAYDGVAFHRVIDGFMAQTGDVQYGNMNKGFDARRAARYRSRRGGNLQHDLSMPHVRPSHYLRRNRPRGLYRALSKEHDRGPLSRDRLY